MNRITVWAIAAMMALLGGAMAQSGRYGIGRTATPEEIRRRDISVAPDGSGLPTGHGAVTKGRAVYEERCANCHGNRGEGSPPYPALVGGRGTLASRDPVLTVGSYWPYATTVWDYIHRTMPYSRPGSLSTAETYEVTTFILYLNGIVDERADLNEKTLPQVKMPNREGFVGDPRPDVGKEQRKSKD
ncbi:MAG: c-type cytochrome [Candidatus Acidiferrales bacterium]